ncbi:MAG: GntR family transcriptional regulator [Clostridiales Family XIII bacterium]|jgi:DNA-binding GntR family transcriptional regulator|nr:GntR family transcriptional regulator [Clostridiales Family XIII bacterium]
MTQRKVIQPQKTAGESVYEFLKNSIIQLWLKPGQKLNIKELTEYLKVSRAPIRDALIRLEKEGLIVSVPQRSTTVSKIDVKRASNEFFMRLCLEEKVLDLFIDIATEAHIRRLDEFNIAQKESRDNNDSRSFLNRDDKFHRYFYEQTDKEICFQLLHNNTGHYNRIRLLSCMETSMLDDSIKQHEELIQYIKEKDKKSALDSLRLHLLKVTQDVPKLTGEYPNLFIDAGAKPRQHGNIFHSDYFNTLIHPE